MQTIGEILKETAYPGRGIAIGKSADDICIAYMLTGRSENSKNRVLVEQNGEVSTKPFDESKVDNPALIIYTPIRSIDNHTIVTNGDQTDTIYAALQNGSSFERALETREFEPDGPIFTPRISGLVSHFDKYFTYKLSILKKNNPDALGCNRFTYSYSPLKQTGHFIHTYQNDPLLSFAGEPKPIYIPNDIDEFARDIWNSLDENNKISIYVKYTNIITKKSKSVLINTNK